MMKKLLYISALFLLLFSSCKSKRNLVSPLPQQVLKTDSALLADTVGVPSSLMGMFTFDQSGMRNLRRPTVKKPPRKPQPAEVAKSIKQVVQKGTKITTHTIGMPTTYQGIDRIKEYHMTHRDVPAAFDGIRLAFVADLHYKSLLKEEGLNDLVRLLISLQPDALLLGGDFHEGCQYVAPVMAALGRVKTPLGTYAVLGNNDYEACYADVVRELKRNDIHLLEHKVDTLKRGNEQILIAGVRNPFDLTQNGQSPTLSLATDDFVILLTHTPDYAEDVLITNTDLVLAGHTHGGQVTLFGLYAPIVPSNYGQRFLSGLKSNSKHIPMIITNGIGTSKRAVRMFAPAEVVMVVLHQLKE